MIISAVGVLLIMAGAASYLTSDQAGPLMDHAVRSWSVVMIGAGMAWIAFGGRDAWLFVLSVALMAVAAPAFWMKALCVMAAACMLALWALGGRARGRAEVEGSAPIVPARVLVPSVPGRLLLREEWRVDE